MKSPWRKQYWHLKKQSQVAIVNATPLISSIRRKQYWHLKKLCLLFVMSSVSKYPNSKSNTQTHHTRKMKCPICLENRKFEFKCSTCNEGGFCLDCYKNISKQSFTFEGTNVHDMINCPCCRSPNWFWLLKDILIWFDGWTCQ